MSSKISNKHYREFLDRGIIEIITEKHIAEALENVKGRHSSQGRALLIVMYYSGARPIECLALRAKDIQKSGRRYISIFFPSSKGGMARTLEFKITPMILELWRYRARFQDDVLIFWNYRSKRKRVRTLKSGKFRELKYPADTLTYHFKRWFKGVLDDPIPPYYLRHSRISQLAMTGEVSEEQLRVWKGSKTAESVRPYTHLTKKTLRKITRYLK